jgi:hypothetical protein
MKDWWGIMPIFHLSFFIFHLLARMAKLVNVAVSEAVVAILESSSLSSGTKKAM